jgi:very-short-patch-repair endonuclease
MSHSAVAWEYVNNYFTSLGCQLLESTYEHANSKLKFMCSCKKVGFKSFSQFRRDKRCSLCKRKTERIVSDFLQDEYKNIISQPKFEWCKNKTFLPFDFLLDDHRTLIEVDGMQHFKQVSNWQRPEKTQERDLFKMKCALENNYKVIRIFQEDIFNNTIDWKTLIKSAVENNDENVIYISKDAELYSNYKCEIDFPPI